MGTIITDASPEYLAFIVSLVLFERLKCKIYGRVTAWVDGRENCNCGKINEINKRNVIMTG
jgi:hypothetical protein